jgi:hypothetical protein
MLRKSRIEEKFVHLCMTSLSTKSFSCIGIARKNTEASTEKGGKFEEENEEEKQKQEKGSNYP